MPKDDWVYVGHMLDMSLQAEEILAGKDRANYDQDVVLRLAPTHLVQVIGEAAQRVSKEFQSSYPQVPWREIIGMRNRIVHDYRLSQCFGSIKNSYSKSLIKPVLVTIPRRAIISIDL